MHARHLLTGGALVLLPRFGRPFSAATMPSFEILPFEAGVANDGGTTNSRPIKRIHIVRHAEGTHNVNKEYRSRKNIDAPLTEKGEQQCESLAAQIRQATPESNYPLWHLGQSADLIVTSPLRRCIQTATLSFQPLLEKGVPMVSHEFIRETVNFNCDRRRSLHQIATDHPHVDFSHLPDNHDAIWQAYEDRFGCDETFTKHRESGEIHVVADRGRAFFAWLQQRPETDIVVCTHSAFLRCIKNYGNSPENGPLGVPDLPKQHTNPPLETTATPVLKYANDALARAMTRDYENCELRSMVIAF